MQRPAPASYGGAGNDSVTIGGAANTLTYEGGIGADTLKLVVLSTAPPFMEITHLQLKVVMIPSPLLAQHLVLISTPTLVNDSTQRNSSRWTLDSVIAAGLMPALFMAAQVRIPFTSSMVHPLLPD